MFYPPHVNYNSIQESLNPASDWDFISLPSRMTDSCRDKPLKKKKNWV